MNFFSNLMGGPKLRNGAKLALEKRWAVSRDSHVFRFTRPKELEELPVGAHLMVSALGLSDRPYTPISAPKEPFIDLLVKVYNADKEKNIPGGAMSMRFDKLKEGDTITFTGPLGDINAHGNELTISNPWDNTSRKLNPKRILMLAAGTGITPMYSLLTLAKIPATLLFFNRTDEDILLRKELEQLQSDSFTFVPIVEQGTTAVTGRITREVCGKYAPACDIALCCGPPPFEEAAQTLLEDHLPLHTF